MSEMAKNSRIMSQPKTRTLKMMSAILILNYYADVASGQRSVLKHFKGTQHKITQPKLTALLSGNGFKNWEEYPHFTEARAKARAKADRQNPNGPRPKTPDQSDDVLTFKRYSPSSVYYAKVRIDEVWCKFSPEVRERVSTTASGADGAAGQ